MCVWQVQFLHCLQQAEQGGESEVVDGFHMAELLRREDPEAFNTLSSLYIDYTDIGSDYCDFSVQSKNRIIEWDKNKCDRVPQFTTEYCLIHAQCAKAYQMQINSFI